MCKTSRILAVGLLVGLLFVSPIRAADSTLLPRKSGHGKDESYPGVTVLYDAIRDAAGRRLRLITTHPVDLKARLPTIFVVGWLSCDTIEAPPGTVDGSQRMLQALVQTPGFATVRLEKPGVGDSDGDCAHTDFTAELAAYRLGFRYLMSYRFVDPQRLFLFGMSNGGGFAPLVAEGTPIRGYIVDGGWIKTWFEHMLEIERRRLVLTGQPPSQINPLMSSVARLYDAYLLKKQSPREIFQAHPELKTLWDGAPDQQYGRPTTYFQQLQDLNLMAAWASVQSPVLALHGEYDWIMSRGDFEILVDLVNRHRPRSAEFVELPQTGHTFEHYASQEDAFAGKQLPFDQSIVQRVRDFLMRHQN